jgi:hypothetical protein
MLRDGRALSCNLGKLVLQFTLSRGRMTNEDMVLRPCGLCDPCGGRGNHTQTPRTAGTQENVQIHPGAQAQARPHNKMPSLRQQLRMGQHILDRGRAGLPSLRPQQSHRPERSVAGLTAPCVAWWHGCGAGTFCPAGGRKNRENALFSETPATRRGGLRRRLFRPAR